MYRQRFTLDGKRKYLTDDEICRFIDFAQQQERGEARTFCLVLAYIGCRILKR